MDACIAALAERQYGVVGRGQLEDLGLKSGSIGRRVRAGRLHRLYWAVYAVGHKVLSREGRWMAAVLACGPGAVLSHHSAAAHWGVRDHRGGPIHITSPSKSKSRGSIRRHCAQLPTDETMVHEGIRVTTVPRTIFDLAAVSTPQAVESALRQSEFLRLHDSLSLHNLIDRYPGHRGIRSVRTALARRSEAPGRIRSRLEERFLPLLDRHDLPRPQLNAWLEANGQRFQVDCLWPVPRQIVELDGWEGHGTRTAFRDDRARDRALGVAGYSVTRLTWSQLEDEPTTVARDLRSLLQGQPDHHRNHT